MTGPECLRAECVGSPSETLGGVHGLPGCAVEDENAIFAVDLPMKPWGICNVPAMRQKYTNQISCVMDVQRDIGLTESVSTAGQYFI